jgi:hypothetical protein
MPGGWFYFSMVDHMPDKHKKSNNGHNFPEQRAIAAETSAASFRESRRRLERPCHDGNPSTWNPAQRPGDSGG